jgi:hypothetical protein
MVGGKHGAARERAATSSVQRPPSLTLRSVTSVSPVTLQISV